MSQYARVSRSHPCPVCGKPDYCTIREDGLAAKCCRVHDGKTARKSGEDGAGRWTIHKLDNAVEAPAVMPSVPKMTIERATQLAKNCCERMPKSRLTQLSDLLGISAEVLKLMRLGWIPASGLRQVKTADRGHAGAWTFPMRNAAGQITGLRTRFPDGEKRAISGSVSGLFMDCEMSAGGARLQPCVMVVEGPTDCAAGVQLGIPTIGRPSNTSGAGDVANWCKANESGRIVLIADRDEPGSRAQENTAMGIAQMRDAASRVGIPCRVIIPRQHKDLREYVNAGGTKDALMRHIELCGSRKKTA